MPQSLSYLLVHVIFSTRGRAPLLKPPLRYEVHAYLATIARNNACECFCVGGVDDHVHLSIRLSRTLSLAKLIEELKTESSKWLKTKSPNLALFSWQNGYAAFSVGPQDLPALRQYIETQEEHHKKRDFREELLVFLQKYGVEHDERYLWD